MFKLIEDRNKPKQGFQGLQAFTFSVITINDNHTDPSSKGSIGFKYKSNICAKCGQGSGLKATAVFVIFPSQDDFENDCPEKKVQTNHFLKSAQKQPYVDVLQNGFF